MNEICVASNTESLLITPDERHGKVGFRVTRYTPSADPRYWDWDESYQFYESEDAAKSALGNPEMQEAGRAAF